jgi:hypothetical protein
MAFGTSCEARAEPFTLSSGDRRAIFQFLLKISRSPYAWILHSKVHPIQAGNLKAQLTEIASQEGRQGVFQPRPRLKFE